MFMQEETGKRPVTFSRLVEIRYIAGSGSIRPRAVWPPALGGKYAPRKLDDVVVEQSIAKHPDATLAELGEEFAVSAVAMWKACRRLQITRKKNAPVH